jgi:predicted membrane-bound spermidine synthase
MSPMSLARRFTPHAVFFGASACIMMLELVAGRLIARYLGNSLYTWTSVIGVVLAGMGAGNVFGGYLADRRNPHVALRWLLFAAAAVCLLALGTNHLFAEYRPFKGLEWPVQILVCVALTFGPAAIALG